MTVHEINQEANRHSASAVDDEFSPNKKLPIYFKDAQGNLIAAKGVTVAPHPKTGEVSIILDAD